MARVVFGFLCLILPLAQQHVVQARREMAVLAAVHRPDHSPIHDARSVGGGSTRSLLSKVLAGYAELIEALDQRSPIEPRHLAAGHLWGQRCKASDPDPLHRPPPLRV